MGLANEMMRTLARLLLWIVVALPMASCHTTDDGPTPARRVDFCTVVATAPPLLEVDADGHTALLSPTGAQLPDGARVGMRLVAEYLTYDYALAGEGEIPVELIAAVVPLQGPVQSMPAADISALTEPQATILAAARAGNFINMQILAQYDGSPRSLAAAADASTLTEPTVRIYLYNPGTPVDAGASVERKCFASFDMASLGLRSDQELEFCALPQHNAKQ